MTTIHSLLVGIDDYPPLMAPSLGGCLNDIAGVRRLLDGRTPEPAVHVLLDREATVEAVEHGILDRLGAAGPGDTALLWFSGHGTRQRAHGADLLIEATGHNQALVCADGLLPDKRLRVLLDEVAARGAHVVAVLDCCFSGGATRETVLTARYAPFSSAWAITAPESARDAVPARPVAPPAGGEVLLLAASRADQPAHEAYFEGRRHGVFTRAVLDVVRDTRAGVTYREVLSAADARVQCSGGLQQPVLFPPGLGGTADTPFLADGTARRTSAHLLRHGAAGWEVDCGAGHGLREDTPAGAAAAEFTAVDEGPAETERIRPGAADTGSVPTASGRVLTARTVLPDRTLVDPVGWIPAPEQVYPVALTALNLPAATVTIDPAGPSAAGPAGSLEEALRKALATAGPGGGPSPLLHQVSDPREAGDLHFRLAIRGSAVHVLRRDGSRFVAPLPLSAPGDARQVADCLTHLTRWHRLRDLTPRPSPLDGLVRVEIGHWGAPSDRPLVPDGSGEIVCAYAPGDVDHRNEPKPPLLSVRLHNRSPDRALWCLLLDLSDGYGSHTALYPGHFIAPGHTGHALDGEPVHFSLPAGQAPVPGAEARDWLKLIVAECELNTVPFHLPAWAARPAGSRMSGTDDRDGVLRFSQAQPGPYSRDLYGVAARPSGHWTSRTIALRTVVPKHPDGH
ncbi:caspase domain-containing protein [Streptomyces sp. NPDC050529]|uniref:caspase family protein n=1 Tax=unclassified Streptomyces TaxID=2593676 RepID=UPI002DD822AF|nr:caspase family protein [Streptomyces sp. NBC_01022]WRZ81607.1 caspase family protein [Streptomyces sp. NBC_01022]